MNWKGTQDASLVQRRDGLFLGFQVRTMLGLYKLCFTPMPQSAQVPESQTYKDYCQQRLKVVISLMFSLSPPTQPNHHFFPATSLFRINWKKKKESTLHAVCVVCYVKDDHLLQSGVQHACLPDMHFTLFQLSLNAMGLENLQYHLWSLSISILL